VGDRRGHRSIYLFKPNDLRFIEGSNMFRVLAPAVLAVWMATFSVAQNATSASSTAPVAPVNVTVSASSAWTDTKLDVQAGQTLNITATAGKGACDPQGKSGAAADKLPVAGATTGALIGKLSSSDNQPFVVGATQQINVQQAGHLYLAANDGSKPVCQGDFQVAVQVMPPASIQSKLEAAAQTWLSGQFGLNNGSSSQPATAASNSSGTTPSAASSSTTPLTVSQAALDSQLTKNLDALPRRVNDEFKNLGDMVNFVIIGSADDLQSSLAAAKWMAADKSTEEAVMKAVLETYEKKDYVQMPMSTLYLYGRSQDYGYELAEAYSVVASRHHFRVWKAPFTWNGQTVWVGAGTHDIGFEKDQRNGKVTHKIDPSVDGERDNIGETLQKAGKVKELHYYLPSNPVQEAKNATGGSYHSDGRVLVIFLK
jgi:LssY C-terminus